MPLTIETVLKEGVNALKACDKDDAILDARLLLMYVLKYDRVKLIIDYNQIIDEDAYKKYMQLIKSRASGIPFQYLIKQQEFMGLAFKVNEHTLIPRRETEELVEFAISILDNHTDQKLIMDMGTGSGCIPISLAVHLKKIYCLGIDYSLKALEVAKENARTHFVQEKISWIFSDLFKEIDKKYMNKVDMILSNPPYIKTADISFLTTEVKDCEPFMALDGGMDGLDFYRKICNNSRDYLKDQGRLLFEIGYNQKDEVMEILKTNGFRDIGSKKDLSGMDRIVYGTK